MKRIMNFLMLSCQKASELIDKQTFVKLTFKEKARLHMHTSMCDACTAYQKQSKFLDEVLDHHVQLLGNEKVPQISNSALKQKLISNL